MLKNNDLTLLINEEKSIRSESSRGNDLSPSDESSKIKCWIFQMLLWLSIISFIIIINVLDPKHFEKLMKKRINKHIRNEFIIFIPLFIILYFLYIKFELSSKTYKFISNINKVNKVLLKELLGDYFSKPPIISFSSESYHYIQDSFGSRKKKVKDEKICNKKDTKYFEYYSAKDVSGVFSLDELSIKKNKYFINLNLKTEINFADEPSCYYFWEDKDNFWKLNRYTDEFMDYSESRTLEDFNENQLVQITEKNPKCISKTLFILFTFLTFAELYKLYFKSLIIHKDFTIRKIISSVANLMDNDNINKYKKLKPCIKLGATLIEFKDNKTGFIKDISDQKNPTNDIINQSMKYKNYIPEYETIDVFDCESGIVKDIHLQNTLFDTCPSNHLDGNMSLPKDKINDFSGNNINELIDYENFVSPIN